MRYYVKVANMDGRMVEGVVEIAHSVTDEFTDEVLQLLGVSYTDDTLPDWWIDEWEIYEDEVEEEEEEYTWWDVHEDEYMEEYFERKYSRP